MNQYFKRIHLIVLISAIIFLVAAPAFVRTTVAAQRASSVSITTIINGADTEINQRIQVLNDLILRISAMKKLSSDGNHSLNVLVQNEIDELTALKAKIDSDTSLPTAKTDYQSITKSYRIYALVLPQIRIAVASDRVSTIVDDMKMVGNKVQSRISGLTGVNVATINNMFADFTEKVSDASAQAIAATGQALALQPDQGDQTRMLANMVALKEASAKLKTVNDDLIAARKDIGDIAKFLRENKATTTGSSNSALPPATPPQ